MRSFRPLPLLIALATTVAVLTAPTAQAGGAVTAFYNHAYGVLDKPTADAIENSAYLREFANFEVRTTTGGGQTWKGRYLKGRETYVELFAVGDLPGQDAEKGSAALAISTDRQGGYPKIVERLRRAGIDPFEYQQTRDFGDGTPPIPWFDAVFAATEYDAFGGWAMEYEPSYLDDPRSKTEPAQYEGDLSRERYLPDAYRDHLMRDITGITFAVTSRDLDQTVPLLRAGGFKIRTTPTGIIAQSDFTTVRLDRAERPQAGLKQLQFRLNHPTPRHIEHIGTSTLTVGPGPRAEWNFS
ncbi:DUF5829 family protein [Kribbella sp. NBC_01505]|uniref:DUF5829 family protein n=1 Tax=Kribbella sp. NBC_01505 TaxID=2903580 RepID=UPI003869C28D